MVIEGREYGAFTYTLGLRVPHGTASSKLSQNTSKYDNF